jgi:putative NADH-flavin reductase
MELAFRVGQVVLREALWAGYRVRLLARSPHKLGAVSGAVDVVEGDLLDVSALRNALRGSRAVLSAAGGVKEPDQYGRFQRIGRNLLGVMEEQGIRRLVSISGAVAVLPGESLGFQRRLMRAMVGLFFRQMRQAQTPSRPSSQAPRTSIGRWSAQL